MGKTRIILAVAICLFTASAVFAQTPVGPSISLAIVPVGGLAVVAGDYSDIYDPSFCVGGEVDVKIGPVFAITGTGIYNEFSAKTPALGPTPPKAKTWEFGAGLKYNIVPTPVAKPFIRVGAGFYNRDLGGTSTDTNFGLNGGAGIDVDLPASKLGFTADARYHNVFVSGTKWKYFNIYGGIRFTLM